MIRIIKTLLINPCITGDTPWYYNNKNDLKDRVEHWINFLDTRKGFIIKYDKSTEV